MIDDQWFESLEFNLPDDIFFTDKGFNRSRAHYLGEIIAKGNHETIGYYSPEVKKSVGKKGDYFRCSR
mgnify:FL=1